MGVGLDKDLKLKSLDSSRVGYLILPTKQTSNLDFPLMMCAILQSNLRNNLKIENPSTPPLLKVPPIIWKFKLHTHKSKPLTRVRALLVSHLLEGKKSFNCRHYKHFQVNCPNRKVLNIRESEEIQAIEEEYSEEEVSLQSSQMLVN